MTTTTVGELTVERDGDLWTIHGPSIAGEAVQVDAEPEAMRELARFDATGSYRPLSGASGLVGDWFAKGEGEAALTATLDAIYPLAPAHIEAWRAGGLRVVGLDEVLARQTGRYEVAATLSPEGRERAAAVMCRGCVRSPVWRGAEVGEAGIPCPEPCSVLVALCREAALWEREPPHPVPPDPRVPFAQFEEAGNAIRERYLMADTEPA